MTISDPIFRAAIVFIAACIGFMSLEAAQSVFAPILTAIVIGVVFSPLANFGERLGLPNSLVAVSVMVIGLLVVVSAGLLLERPVRDIVDQGPQIWSKIRVEVMQVRAAISGLEEFTDNINEMVDGDKEGISVNAKNGNGSMAAALQFAPAVLAQVVIFIGALFFFILSRRELYHAIARLGRSPDRKERLYRRIEWAERMVARYFIAITAINAVLGLATAFAMYQIGMPAPILLGVLAAFLNYMPYLGPAVMICVLGATSVVAFDGPFVIVPPLTFLALNFIEGQFLTPAAIGHQARVNALLIFASLVFWMWLWGPIGGFVAIPVLLGVLAFLTPMPAEEVVAETAYTGDEVKA